MANEKRLIDANALRKQMFSYYGCVNENSSKEYYRGETLMNYEVADLIEDCIDNAPTVDAVEVVRCKDCKGFEKMESNNSYFCNVYGGYVKEEDYCSRAQPKRERKDNGTTKD